MLLEGTCPTCRHYGKAVWQEPCSECDMNFDMYEGVDSKTYKYDVTLFYADKKTEIFDNDKVELFNGTVLVLTKKGIEHYYPIYQIFHYEIHKKEVNTNDA